MRILVEDMKVLYEKVKLLKPTTFLVQNGKIYATDEYYTYLREMDYDGPITYLLMNMSDMNSLMKQLNDPICMREYIETADESTKSLNLIYLKFKGLIDGVSYYMNFCRNQKTTYNSLELDESFMNAVNIPSTLGSRLYRFNNNRSLFICSSLIPCNKNDKIDVEMHDIGYNTMFHFIVCKKKGVVLHYYILAAQNI